MKNIFLLFLTLTLFSCKTEEKKEQITTGSESSAEGEVSSLTPAQQMGQEIFDGKGNCFTCHKPKQKAIGPSIKEIAKVYKEKKGDIPTFLKGKGEPIVDPSQYETMKTNFYITKNFSDEELKAVEAYIYSLAP
ncbi:cytochrome C552 [Flavobacterium album]|uniref:Cytochrome C552 n=1 Tax=Flavobacterium album TaxID=2175091 RepID=A0A2S1QVS3_9FLAO|nr:c-type cytochrome [Flavobacterium album]AWH84517.1 cytochrome C552 [Flavobacterium album]